MKFHNVTVFTQIISRRTLSLVLSLVILTGLASAAPDAASIRTQIVETQLGANIELHLKNKQRVRGSRGAVSDAGFTIVEGPTGERQIVFDDVVSVKRLTPKSHTGLKILAGVAIGVVGMVAVLLVSFPGTGL